MESRPTPSRSQGQPTPRHRRRRGIRVACQILLVLLAVAAAFYYPILTLAVRTLIPFLALTMVGFFLGLVFKGGIFWPCAVTWEIVLFAALFRRLALADLPLATQIFDGALFGYPTWAVWTAEVGRLVVYFGALWLGASLGRRMRRGRNRAE